MSVQANTYVMHGVLLPYKELPEEASDFLDFYDDSPFEESVNPRDDLTVLIGDQYIAVGHVIVKSREGEGLHPILIPANAPEYDQSILRGIVKGIGYNPDDCKPGWIVFTHYR